MGAPSRGFTISLGVETIQAVPPPLDFDATENENVAAGNAVTAHEHRQLLLGHFQAGLQHAGCPPGPPPPG